MRNILDQIEFLPLPNPERLHLAMDTLIQMKSVMDEVCGIGAGDLTKPPPNTFAGIQFVETPGLPIPRPCMICRGSGTIPTRTYCPECNGQGGDRVIGYLSGPKPTFITEPLHAKIPPCFPSGIVAPPPFCRGLP